MGSAWRSIRKPQRRLVAAGFVVLTSMAAIAGAAQPPPDDERRQPLQELIRTEVVYPQERGEVQLTLGSVLDRGRDGHTLVFPAQFEFGLTDAWQVALEWETYTRVRSGDAIASGRGAMVAATKYSFMNIKGSGIHAALGVEAEFPGGPGPDGVQHEVRTTEPFLALAADFRHGVQGFFHVGRSFAGGHARDEDGADVEEFSSDVQWNAGALMALRQATVACEVNARSNGSPWSRGELYATPSLTFRLPTAWEVGFGIPIGLNGRSDRFGFSLHIVYER